MSPEQWRRIEALFQLAVVQRPATRSLFLSEVCADDPDLRAEVESLLEADSLADELSLEPPSLEPPSLEPPSLESPAPGAASRGRLETPPAVGPYRVVSQLGEGGTSVVYLAVRSDDQYQRRVAIKLIRQGMASPDQLRRFHVERQILAGLDHPSVARLYDGGTTDQGLPYVVMEYVEGEPIDRYCESHLLSVAERLELIRQVCAAVNHAHQNLVVHRDLKPGNILVTEDGTPKVVDFGIAKLLNPELGPARIEPTRSWIRLMTPDFASPEQVCGQPVSMASDVYSLGVLLYLLLTGRLPHQLSGRTPEEIERVLKTTEPPLPSVVSGQRGLRGDLDHVVLKALRKETRHRYGSVEQFSEDLRRYQTGLPVLARKGSFAYYAGKFVRRHRLGVAMAALVGCLGALIVVLSILQAARLETQRDEAWRERDKARQIAAFLEELFQISDQPALTPQPSSGSLLARGSALIDGGFAEQGEVRAALRRTLGKAYQGLGMYARAEPLLRTALSERRSELGPEHPDVAESLNDLGYLLTLMGNLDEAETALREALALRLELFGTRHLEVAQSLNDLGHLHLVQGDPPAAAEVLHEAFAVFETTLGVRRQEVADIYSNLGQAYFLAGDYERARDTERAALELVGKLRGPEHPTYATRLDNLAVTLTELGELDEAEDLVRRALGIRLRVLGEKHPDVAVSRSNLSGLLRFRGDLDGALTELNEAIELQVTLFGREHPEVATSLNNLGVLYSDNGVAPEAVEAHREALEIRRRVFGPEHPEVARSLHHVAGALRDQGDFSAAESAFTEALALRRSLLGPRHPDIAYSLAGVGQLYLQTGRPQEAEDRLRDAVAILEHHFPPDHVLLVRAQATLEKCREALGREPEVR